jgi:hypothetical protein
MFTPARGGAHLLARHTLPLQEMVPLGRVLPISPKLGPLLHMVHTCHSSIKPHSFRTTMSILEDKMLDDKMLDDKMLDDEMHK